ncbi:MAG: Plug domain-containing protein, partial [Pseudomonadota bacterium]|nr:Plug domain-containing protein [Pseudomonadota bacterium]
MVLLAFSHSSSHAQTTDEIIVKGKVLYSDQVNALKTPVPILNVPQSLSIVTDEDIRAQGFRSLGDIVRYTPGVNTSQGEGHRDAIVFRGVRSTADFYLDG